jgi:signal peptidase II
VAETAADRRPRHWLWMLVVGAIVVAIDQATKAAVVSSLALGESRDLVLGFDLTRVTNSGIAFGLLDEGSDALVLAITGAALLVVVGWFAVDATRPWLWLGVGLLVGGAIGNLIDRIRLGSVTDFINPPVWPAFNFADISITLGVLVVVLVAFGPAPESDLEPHGEPAES